MNVILNAHLQPGLDDRYVVLELDTIKFSYDHDPATAYCLLEKVAIQDIYKLDEWRNLHSKLMKNYRQRNWDFCLQALDHLQGLWQGELDSFYKTLRTRIETYVEHQPGDDWNGVVDKLVAVA